MLWIMLIALMHPESGIATHAIPGYRSEEACIEAAIKAAPTNNRRIHIYCVPAPR